MARKAARPADPEEQESAEKAVSKTDAVRAALQEGVGVPQEAVVFIKRRFDIDMLPQQFSTLKSQLKKRAGEEPRARKAPAKRSPAPDGSAAAEASSDGATDLLGALEAIKPLIASYGAERVKRMVDLLG